MNTTIIFTGVLSCLLLMFTITHSFAVSGKTVDDDHLSLIAHPSAMSNHKLLSIDQDDGSILDDSDEHEFEKRRFNAWAGKRSLMAKRRFNAWAGRR